MPENCFQFPYFEGNCINIGEKFRQSLTSSYKHAVKHAKRHSIVALPWCCKLKFGLIFNEVEAINGKPYFVGKDVAEILGYTNPTKAMQDHIDEDDMTFNETLKLSRQTGAWIINESGLYSLILSSKLPNAKKLKHWYRFISRISRP